VAAEYIWLLLKVSFWAEALSIEEVAKRNFDSGFNCAESTLAAVKDGLGARGRAGDPVIPRIATGFGGGISRNGDVCGAIIGGVMAISLALGRDKSEQSREPCYRAVDRFYNDFRIRFGSCKCRELTNTNLKTAEGAMIYKTEVHTDVCLPLVAWAAKRASDIIEETTSAGISTP
jgi:C_GCAxxG_C_C family probable redox protein